MGNVVYPSLPACYNHLPFCLSQNITSCWLRKHLSSCKCTETQALQLNRTMGTTQEHSLCHLQIASVDVAIGWSIYLAKAIENAIVLRWIISFIKISLLFLEVWNVCFYGPEEKKEFLAGRKRFSGSLSICTETEFKRLNQYGKHHDTQQHAKVLSKQLLGKNTANIAEGTANVST